MMTTPPSFTPIRAKSGRYLCDYDPVRQLLLFKNGKVNEVVDLSEYGPPSQAQAEEAAEAPPMVRAMGYVLLPVEVARLIGLVGGGYSADGEQK